MAPGRRHRHRNHIRYLDTLRGAIGMLRDPHHTESVFDIEDGLRGLEATRLAMEHVRRDPDMARLIEERYLRREPPDMTALSRLAEGSLGHVFARHMTERGFDPDYFRKRPVRDDIDYVLMRLRETHDIWHVVTGFDTDPIGELGIKAVELAQTRRPMAAVIASGGVIRYLVKEPEALGRVLAAISAGYQLGLHARLLLAQRWEEHWDRSLAEWRRRLGVVPVGEIPTAEWGRARTGFRSPELTISPV